MSAAAAERSLGPYVLRRLLGSGGMGEAWEGRDPRFDRAVAIKVLHAALARDADISARFRSEAVIQAKLSRNSVMRR